MLCDSSRARYDLACASVKIAKDAVRSNSCFLLDPNQYEKKKMDSWTSMA